MDENHTDQVSLKMGFLSWSRELGCKVMTSRHVPLDRRIFDFWFLISDFWFLFLISDFRFPISDFGFRISDFWFLISDFWFPFSVFRFRTSDFWFLISYFLSPDSWFLFSAIRKYLPSILGSDLWIQKTDWPQSFLIHNLEQRKSKL